jgi:lipoate-protein ligase A
VDSRGGSLFLQIVALGRLDRVESAAMWDVIDTGVLSAEENMRKDAEFLERASALTRPLVHFYEWERPSLTHGYFIDPKKLLHVEKLQARGWDLARRPTGGGVVFHMWDMAFSVVVPAHSRAFSLNTLDNYAFVNRAVLKAVEAFLPQTLELTPLDSDSIDANCSHFCMARPTRYDVVWQGRKVAGAAQRKTREGFLHQGTIALIMPSSEVLQEVLLPETQVALAMQRHTLPLLGEGATERQCVAAKGELKRLLTVQLTQGFLE